MPLFDRILVPTDLTGSARMAIRHGITLARELDADLHLLHVMEEVEGGDMIGLPPLTSVYQRLREVVSVEMRLTTREEGGKGLDVEQHIVRGSGAAPVILDYAVENDIDLIVMGTHGRHGGERFMIGSTAERVVRFAECAVLTVGARSGWAPGVFNRIVGALDFSEASVSSVRWARKLAGRFRARVDLLHVIEPVIQPAFRRSDGPDVFAFRGGPVDEKVKAKMKEVYKSAGGPEVHVRYHIRRGRPSREVVRFADDVSSNLIVQGTRGFANRTGMARMGRVAEAVVRSAPCPVFTSRKSAGQSEMSRPRPAYSDV